MVYVIAEACIGVKDSSCVDVCPVECIYETASMRVIAPDECIDCGACVPECPVDAIYRLDLLPAELGQFVEVNALWSTGGSDAVELALTQVSQSD